MRFGGDLSWGLRMIYTKVVIDLALILTCIHRGKISLETSDRPSKISLRTAFFPLPFCLRRTKVGDTERNILNKNNH